MKIRTSRFINTSSERLWPLLTNSRMDVPGWFCLGVPQPKSCELPNTNGEVGAERRCISDRGTVIQKITEWDPPVRLRFKMLTTDHTWGPCVESLEEDFHLEVHGSGTRITRTTTITASGIFPWLKELGFYSGLKRVHLYVFHNWKKHSEEGLNPNS
ncbi:SRPBCC family protein [Persicirhabdus sediminis]|uniref:SRPBCC family protein n=1 Tax=Persicirhabdus sediminis TaxID=454144 RepID=A0A8J7SJ16_9BACT|nr:SRPBCC family protein [Persicirhabdus sediminis]MBK1789910.1 SRPBCC family protein [Persicirhabdus sediminis]